MEFEIQSGQRKILENLGGSKPEVLDVVQKDKLSIFTGSPMFADLVEISASANQIEETRALLKYLVEMRNSHSGTKKEVLLDNYRRVTLYDNESDPTGTGRYLEMSFSIPQGMEVNEDILKQITEFYAREVSNEETGASERIAKEKGELPEYSFIRTWDYDQLDKKVLGVRKVNPEAKKVSEKYEVVEDRRHARRKNTDTGGIVFVGKTSNLVAPGDIREVLGIIYTDDVSAKPGILFHTERPKQSLTKYINKPFSRLPLIIPGSNETKKIVLRFNTNYRTGISEADLYFLGILFSDILSGRTKYSPRKGAIGSVGANYKTEVSAIMAALNHQRFKDISLDSLPGVGEIADTVQTHLLGPLGEGRIEDAQDIMIVGTPGTGKTALTTAFSRIDNGCALVSVPAKEFLEEGKKIIGTVARFFDRYGIYTALVLQDAESLFTNALITGSEGAGAAVDPDKRQFVLELLGGERKAQAKFLLTINKPGYIDEALRRRFLSIYFGLPKAEDYGKISEACLGRLFKGPRYDAFKNLALPLIANESYGYPPAFTAKLCEMLVSPVGKLNGHSNDVEFIQKLINDCAIKLKHGYPIKEIRDLDAIAKKMTLQMAEKVPNVAHQQFE